MSAPAKPECFLCYPHQARVGFSSILKPKSLQNCLLRRFLLSTRRAFVLEPHHTKLKAAPRLEVEGCHIEYNQPFPKAPLRRLFYGFWLHHRIYRLLMVNQQGLFALFLSNIYCSPLELTASIDISTNHLDYKSEPLSIFHIFRRIAGRQVESPLARFQISTFHQLPPALASK